MSRPLKSGRPRHEQLSDWLRERIASGVFQPNDRLPSESQLVEQFGVSRITVRRALQTLEHEHLIYRRQGLGSFVQDTRVRQGLVRLTDFLEDMQQAGIEGTSRVLHQGVVEAEARVAEALEVEPGTRVLRLDRLRLGDGEPMAFDQTWLPMAYARLIEGRDLTRDTIYGILEREYGLRIERGRYRIDAVNAPAEVAEVLQVSPGRALLLIERTSFGELGRRIYFQRRYYRTDRVTYEMELERDPGQPSTAHGMPLQEFEPVFRFPPTDES
ncbi:MAG: GntR family transcriptional regulator [Bacteroidetes bacterium]|nr:MAG: GntR family transcriptional regulator [Bacteroidota bacterium]